MTNTEEPNGKDPRQIFPQIHQERGIIEKVGVWLWVSFESKPPQELREALKSHHFFWNQKRKVWQNNGGVLSRHSEAATPYIKFKYGAEILDLENTREMV